jgi:hypothetical protein
LKLKEMPVKMHDRVVVKIICCSLFLAGLMSVGQSQSIGQATNSRPTIAQTPSQTTTARVLDPVPSIVDALASAGIPVQPSQIELLSGASALREGATVRMVKMTDAAPGTIRVTLRCQDNRECLPFLVLVHGVAPVKPKSVTSDAMVHVLPKPQQTGVRGGDHATLILETSNSRMSFPVICLQNGNRGQTVRVTSTDRARFYQAEVVAPGLLKGNL